MKKALLIATILIILLMLFSCGNNEPESNMPEDFRFSISWSAHQSSYDSESGKLVKTPHTTHPEEYITELKLTRKELASVWKMINEIDIASYPKEYFEAASPIDPSGDLKFSASYGDTKIEIVCPNTEPGYVEYCISEEAERLVKVFLEIVDMLCESEEWKALPDYEFLPI